MSNLALLGGRPVFEKPLKPYCSISKKEIEAVNNVLKSGCLSGFFGSWEEGFLGGPFIQKLEENWSKKFNVKNSISFNSNTSGLFAAMGAIGISPGDEVIVPCTTMSATAMCPIIYGGIPVFADIDEEYFCIDLESVKSKISSKTKAIIAVNLFGHPAKLKELKSLAKKNDLYLIEDNAQAPLGEENGQLAGTVGDIGVFSLNYHKHIHSGEGGICVTNDQNLATRLQMIRNHAEAVVGPSGTNDIINMVGFNYRMTEMSAAVANIQLKDINQHVAKRVKIAETLSENLKDLEGIHVPKVREDCKHVYYEWSAKFDEKIIGVSREVFVKALNAEGFSCFGGYIQPLYNLPIFKQKIAIGSSGFSFSESKHDYKDDKCPVAESLYKNYFLLFEPCAFEISMNELEKLIDAFKKVYENRSELQGIYQK